MIAIENDSARVRDLRQFACKKRLSIFQLMKQVSGDWTQSKLAPAISYWETKVIHCDSTIAQLLDTIGKFGFAVAGLNATSENYVLGSGVDMHMDGQSNYLCLKHIASKCFPIIISRQSK